MTPKLEKIWVYKLYRFHAMLDKNQLFADTVNPCDGFNKHPHMLHALKPTEYFSKSSLIELLKWRIEYIEDDLRTDTNSSVSDDNRTKGRIIELQSLLSMIEGNK